MIISRCRFAVEQRRRSKAGDERQLWAFGSEGGKVRFPVPRCRSSASRRRAGVHAEPTPGAAANLLIYLTPDRQPVIGGGIYLEMPLI